MKRILIILALLGIVLTGCEKDSSKGGLSTENLVQTLQGTWVAISSDKAYDGDLSNIDQHTDYTDLKNAPALIFEENHVTKGMVNKSETATAIRVSIYAYTLDFEVSDENHFSYIWHGSPNGTSTFENEYDGTHIVSIETSNSNSFATKIVYVRKDLPVEYDKKN